MSFNPADLGLPPAFTAFREGQAETITSLAESLTRFNLLSAPTGTGKSLIYTSVALALSARTLILVSTRALLDQLLRDFESVGMYKILGHSNYDCAEVTKSDFGDEFECLDRDACEYQRRVSVALRRGIVITTYAHWLTLQKSGDPLRLGRFDFLVCDEAHLAMDQTVSQVAIELRESVVRSLLGIDMPKSDRFTTGQTVPIATCRAWAIAAREVALEKYAAAQARVDNHDHSAIRTVQRLTKLGRDLRRFIDESARYEWIAQYGASQSVGRFAASRKLTVSPVWAKPYAEHYLFRGIPHVLLCSATLSSTEGGYLGIGKDESEYTELDSTFALRRRPVIYCPPNPAVRVDYRMTEGELRIVVNRIDSIIDARLNRKGIIHTRSYARAKEIVALSRHAASMLTHASDTTKATVARFKSSPVPCILVSPSVEEGYNFPGDECLWLIIVKVPFLDGRDPMIAARKRTVKAYPYHVTSQTIIQMAGRAVRSASDAAECFIIDGHWSHFSKGGDFPRWFKRAFITSYQVPPPLNLT